MIGENYIQQNEYKIKNYIAEKNFEKAFETYKDLAQKFPYHKDLRYINQLLFSQIAQQSILVRKLISGLKRIKNQ